MDFESKYAYFGDIQQEPRDVNDEAEDVEADDSRGEKTEAEAAPSGAGPGVYTLPDTPVAGTLLSPHYDDITTAALQGLKLSPEQTYDTGTDTAPATSSLASPHDTPDTPLERVHFAAYAPPVIGHLRTARVGIWAYLMAQMEDMHEVQPNAGYTGGCVQCGYEKPFVMVVVGQRCVCCDL